MAERTYHKFLINQQTYNGLIYTDVGSVVDTKVKFGCVCKDSPFKYLPETKELASRDWFDEDGEDVYFPAARVIPCAAYDWEVSFLFTASTAALLRTNAKSFLQYVCGKKDSSDGTLAYSVCLAVYDEYTGIGRRGVYVKEVSPEVFVHDDGDNDCVAEIKVTFRVTDPVTDITLTTSA